MTDSTRTPYAPAEFNIGNAWNNDYEAGAYVSAAQKAAEKASRQPDKTKTSVTETERKPSYTASAPNLSIPSVIETDEKRRRDIEEFLKKNTPWEDKKEIVVPYAPGKAPKKDTAKSSAPTIESRTDISLEEKDKLLITELAKNPKLYNDVKAGLEFLSKYGKDKDKQFAQRFFNVMNAIEHENPDLSATLQNPPLLSEEKQKQADMQFAKFLAREYPESTKELIPYLEFYNNSQVQYYVGVLKEAQEAVATEPRQQTSHEQPAQQVSQNSTQTARMIKMIEHMNKINGPSKAIDAQAAVQAIEKKFGDKAYDVLYKAIMEPTNYTNALDAKNAAGKPIRLSREAVMHLKNADASQANDIAQKLLNYKPENTQSEQLSQTTKSQQTATAQHQTQSQQSADEKRAADMAVLSLLATNNPEQYGKLKEAYQSLVDGHLPGFETAQYFLELIKEVDALLPKALTEQKTQTVNSTAEKGYSDYVTQPTEEEQKRAKDKEGFMQLQKNDPEKFAKAKEAYAAAAKNEATQKDALYYLGIINEIENDNQLKNTMRRDAQNAAAAAKQRIHQVQNGATETKQNSAASQSHQQTNPSKTEESGKKVVFSRDDKGNPVYTLSGYTDKTPNNNDAPNTLYNGTYTVKNKGEMVSFVSADGSIKSDSYGKDNKLANILAKESKMHADNIMPTQGKTYS